MNKDDRKQLEKAIELMEEAKGILEEIGSGEREKYENMSENLQGSEKGQKFEEDANELDEAAESLGEVIDKVQERL